MPPTLAPTNIPPEVRPRLSLGRLHFLILSCGIVLLLLILARIIFLVVVPPFSFTKGSIIHITYGESLMKISQELQGAHVIASIPVFQFFVVLDGGERKIISGDYYFENALPVYQVARNMVNGDFELSQTKVTIPEGFTDADIGMVFDRLFPYYDSATFATLTKDSEGYLFPDTYFISPYADTNFLVKSLKDTFTKKITPLLPDVQASGHSEGDIITMASLIESEAHGDDDRAIISGILWHRIMLGMPLQVDATVLYITGESKISLADLKIDSPYNTYIHTGLPPAPIANPGLLAIEASLHPTTTDYLYYLHDSHGIIHYAKTFEEHKANKAKYLN